MSQGYNEQGHTSSSISYNNSRRGGVPYMLTSINEAHACQQTEVWSAWLISRGQETSLQLRPRKIFLQAASDCLCIMCCTNFASSPNSSTWSSQKIKLINNMWDGVCKDYLVLGVFGVLLFVVNNMWKLQMRHCMSLTASPRKALKVWK